jgi:hypothetical protein
MAMTEIIAIYDLNILELLLIKGVMMGVVDKLSRFEPTPSLPPERRFVAEARPAIRELFRAVDPTKAPTNNVHHHLAYQRVQLCVAALRH